MQTRQIAIAISDRCWNPSSASIAKTRFVAISTIGRIEGVQQSRQFMIKTIEGTYQDGQIHLTELPQDVSRAQVLVTFLDPGKIDSAKLRQLIDQLETIEGIAQGFEELNSGQTRPVRDFVQEMQQKYGISG